MSGNLTSRAKTREEKETQKNSKTFILNNNNK